MPYRAAAARVQSLGATLVVGLLVLAAAAWGFGALAEDVLEGDTGLDDRLANGLHAHATDPLTDFFEAVTKLGNGIVLGGVAAVAAYLLARRGYAREAVFVACAYLGAELLSYSLKLAFRRNRPFFTDPLATVNTYSFPSGHATVSIAVYGAVCVVLYRHLTGRARPACVAAAVVLVSLIGFSRLYLGVHFLSDVLAGYCVGLAWLALLMIVLDVHARRRAPRDPSSPPARPASS